MDPDKDILDFKPDPLIATERIKRRDWRWRNCVSDITYLGLGCENQPYSAFVTKLIIPFKKFTKEAANAKEFKKMEEFNPTQKGIENFLTSDCATYHIQLQIY